MYTHPSLALSSASRFHRSHVVARAAAVVVALVATFGGVELAQAQSCNPGYEPCAGGCMPAGNVCCNDGSGSCNPSYPVCCSGTSSCSTSYEGCNGGSGSGSGSGSSGSGSGSYESCVTADFTSECPTIEACCDTASCWYVADGTRFDCAGYDCYAAADEVVSYCEDAYGGCSTSAERVSSGSAAFGLLGLLGLATTVRVGRWLRARKKKSN